MTQRVSALTPQHYGDQTDARVNAMMRPRGDPRARAVDMDGYFRRARASLWINKAQTLVAGYLSRSAMTPDRWCDEVGTYHGVFRAHFDPGLQSTGMRDGEARGQQAECGGSLGASAGDAR